MPERAATKRPARQQPGLACEECRRRKARCDRAQPQCGACMMTGRVCIVNHNRHRRGPKKGQLKALYSRLEVLEEQLVVQVEGLPASTGPVQESHSRTSSLSQQSLSDDENDAPYELPSSSSVETDPVLSSPIRDFHRPFTSQAIEPVPVPFPPPTLARLDVVHADLDQLYFDRVHPIAPFLHQRRYFTWVSYETPSLARSCLRSAMRTIAAAMSAQFRSLSDKLYAETRTALARLDGNSIERSPPSLEQIQALLLLAHYELLKTDEETAMVTAGRCFRLIQLARLGEADALEDQGLSGQMGAAGTGGTSWNEAFAVSEEKRRTFWVAYCFDRFLSSRREWPLTLQEDAIRTGLPHSEQTFQTTPLAFLTHSQTHPHPQTHSQQPPPPPTLHEAISSSGHTSLPPFSECIVLATLYGRAMTLRRMASVLPSSETSGFWSRHKSLSTSIEKRTQLLARNLASPNTLVAPMVAFTHVLARATVIYLGEVAEAVGIGLAGTASGAGIGGATGGQGEWSAYGIGTRNTLGAGVGGEESSAVSSTHKLAAAAYTQRAFQAAREVVRLVQGIRPVSCFKAHLFLPNSISRAATFLISHNRLTEWEWGRSTNGTLREADALLGVLRDLRATNNLAKELLGELEGAHARIQTAVGTANGPDAGAGNARGGTAYRHGRSHSGNIRGGIS
ncbi:fungal-specific transcription factor domain-containing protein [Aspergillus insuetus]